MYRKNTIDAESGTGGKGFAVGIRNAEEETTGSFGFGFVFAAEQVDGPALHVLHHEEGTAVGIRSSIEQLRDGGVVQIRKDLTSVPETPKHIPFSRKACSSEAMWATAKKTD